MRTILLIPLILLTLGGFTMEEKKELPNFDKLWDYNDPAKTEKQFQEILDNLDDKDENYRLELLTQLARTKGLQKKFEEAHKTLDIVEKSLNDDRKIIKIRYLLERGRVFNSSGKKLGVARFLFLQAYDFGNEHKLDYYTLDAAHMMGIVEPPNTQLDWNLKAIKIAEDSEDKRLKGWLGPLYNNTGWSFHDIGKYEEALGLFQKGYEFRLKIKDEQGARIQKWTIGHALRSLERIEEAYKVQKELEQEIIEKKIAQDGYNFEELGECLLLMTKAEEAQRYFKLAYENLSKDEWLQENEAERLLRLKKLAGLEEK
ncbi:MAG: hypothetical protein K8S23_01860 [Candidatus Cloacimonetes bacterium]|nr:hypothetical protein [Candidatus Cloacimonadota bacterium]